MLLARRIDHATAARFRFFACAGGWDGVILVNARNPANAKYEQKSLSEIARIMNKEPADAAWSRMR